MILNYIDNFRWFWLSPTGKKIFERVHLDHLDWKKSIGILRMVNPSVNTIPNDFRQKWLGIPTIRDPKMVASWHRWEWNPDPLSLTSLEARTVHWPYCGSSATSELAGWIGGYRWTVGQKLQGTTGYDCWLFCFIFAPLFQLEISFPPSGEKQNVATLRSQPKCSGCQVHQKLVQHNENRSSSQPQQIMAQSPCFSIAILVQKPKPPGDPCQPWWCWAHDHFCLIWPYCNG